MCILVRMCIFFFDKSISGLGECLNNSNWSQNPKHSEQESLARDTTELQLAENISSFYRVKCF